MLMKTITLQFNTEREAKNFSMCLEDLRFYYTDILKLDLDSDSYKQLEEVTNLFDSQIDWSNKQ